MMYISEARVTVESTAVTPTLKITALLRHEAAELPIMVDGGLYTESGLLLAPLHAEPRRTPSQQYLMAGGSDTSRQEVRHPLAFWASLSPRHLDVIEDLREKNRKGDVVLKATLSVQYQRLKTELVDLGERIRHVEEPKRASGKRSSAADVAAGFLLAQETGPKHTGPTVLSTTSWVVEQTWHPQEIGATIPGSDWVNDFSPALGRGRFLVLEVPDPSARELPVELRERFSKAAQSIIDARAKLLAGDWTEVCEELRPLYELLRKWPELETLIGSEYAPEAATEFSNAIRSLFEFSSKFVHTVSRDGKTLNPTERAQKEDAHLLYAVSASTLNLIARKWGRAGR